MKKMFFAAIVIASLAACGGKKTKTGDTTINNNMGSGSAMPMDGSGSAAGDGSAAPEAGGGAM